MSVVDNHLVIMAGGVGSRFWPMSTPAMPKQFIDVLGTGMSMLQLTVKRFSSIIPISNVWVVTSKDYYNLVVNQLPDIPTSNILLEPCMRNTAPCIAYVSWKIKKRFKNANIVFSPADHIVLDVKCFEEVISKGLAFTANNDVILTLGMEPTRPETGYGYIKAFEDGCQITHGLGNSKNDLCGIFKVEAFKEKPCRELAQEYLDNGGYFWNSGIFIWNVNTIEKSFRNLTPDIACLFDEISDSFYTPNEQSVVDERFPSCRNISIDYAIMENSSNVYVFPASFGWSDLGTWGSLYTHLEHDDNGNAAVGNVKFVNSKGCISHTPELKKVIVEGLDNYIVAHKGDTLLICKLEDEQDIKQWK